jgi:sodium transport system permease protein
MKDLQYLWIVFKKELMDGTRDKRSIRSLVIGAIMTPLLFSAIFTVQANRQRNSQEIKLPVAGIEYAPALGDWLRQQTGITIVKAPDDPMAAVRDRKEDVIVLIDKNFAKDMARGIPAPVKLLADQTRQEARPKVTRIRNLIATYSAEMASLRLVARGIAPALARPLAIEDVEVSSAQQRLAQLLGILPLLLVIAGLTGGMPIAIDATAGERERGSLEPLLLSPVPRWVLAAGKWLAAASLACGSVVLSMLLMVNVMRRVPWQDMGIRFRVTDGELLSLLVLILPLALLLSSVLAFVSTFARSFKEAQSYIGLLMLVPMIPGIVSQIVPLSGRPYLAPIPVLGQYALAADVLGGKPPAIGYYILAGLAVLAVAGIFVTMAARLLSREKVIFGR